MIRRLAFYTDTEEGWERPLQAFLAQFGLSRAWAHVVFVALCSAVSCAW